MQLFLDWPATLIFLAACFIAFRFGRSVGESTGAKFVENAYERWVQEFVRNPEIDDFIKHKPDFTDYPTSGPRYRFRDRDGNEVAIRLKDNRR